MKVAYVIFMLCVSMVFWGQNVPKGASMPKERQEKIKEPKAEKPRDEKVKEEKDRPLRMATREREERGDGERNVRPDREGRIDRPERPDADMPRMERMEKIYRNEYGYGRKSTPPSKSRMVYHSGVGYRYYKGVYYKPYVKGEWVVSRPPIGVVIAAVMLEELDAVIVPAGVYVRYPKYHYKDGVFYVMDSTRNYCVVSAPVGALVEMLPSGSDRVVKNGEIFFMVDGCRYTPVIHEGVRMYRVDGKVGK